MFLRNRLLSFILLLVATLALGGGLGAQDPPASTSRLNQIDSRGAVRIGLQPDFMPFHVAKAKKGYPGIDVEIGRALAKALGVRADFVFKPIGELLQDVAAGDIDVSLGGISSNLTRGKTVRFARPYLITSPAGLLDRQSLPAESNSVDFPKRRIQGLADLKYLGKLRIGARKGTSNQVLLHEDPFFTKHDIIEFTTRAEAKAALIKGDINLWLADRTFFKALLLQEPGLLTRFSFLSATYREEHLSPAVPPGDPEFLLYVDFFIKELDRNGTLDRLRLKYFESDDWIP